VRIKESKAEGLNFEFGGGVGAADMNTYNLCIIFFLCCYLACSEKHPESIKIQSVEVEQIIPLTKSENGQFAYPKFSPDGSKIVFTQQNHQGLLYYDLQKQHLVSLNSVPGAGVDFIISADHARVFFRSDTLQNRRRYHYLFVQEFKSKKIIRLTKSPYRELSGLTEQGDDELTFYTRDGIRSINWRDKKISTNQSPVLIYRVQGDRLITYQNGQEKVNIPFAGQNLIWPEVIPGTTDILIYVTGRGLVRYSLRRNQSQLLGDFKAARCSPDGRLIAYMRDEDDGHKTIRSDIYIATLDDLESFVITKTEDRYEMYPQWSPSGRHIVFHTADGQIYLAELKMN
jgi:hypothetical protein